MGQNNYGSYLFCLKPKRETKYDWLKAKQFQQCFCVMRQNRHSLLTFPKFGKCLFGTKGKSTAGVILPLEESSWLNWSSDKDNTLGLA